MKVKSQDEDVDQLKSTVKIKTSEAEFATIVCRRSLYQSNIYVNLTSHTRLRCWLNTAFKYAKNLDEVRAIVKSFEGFGILVTQAKVSLQTAHLATQFLKIKDQHKCIVKLIH